MLWVRLLQKKKIKYKNFRQKHVCKKLLLLFKNFNAKTKIYLLNKLVIIF